MATTSQSLKQRVHHGIREFLVITLYLWVIFVLFDVYKSVLVAQYHIDNAAKSFALINALALGKIALIAKELKFDKQLRPTGKPLIYATLLNAAAFSALLACFKILEEAIVGWYHGTSFAESVTGFGGGTWHGILCLSAIFFVMLIPFCAFSELGIALGDRKLTQLFFREHRIE
ncbi:MAG: hypothetical protein JO270_26995 [Acidobacteriaceae bacterium]|nr:hypothetical protein [Acidobacteriaceae bacterium]